MSDYTQEFKNAIAALQGRGILLFGYAPKDSLKARRKGERMAKEAGLKAYAWVAATEDKTLLGVFCFEIEPVPFVPFLAREIQMQLAHAGIFMTEGRVLASKVLTIS